jgi:hypothetical protein
MLTHKLKQQYKLYKLKLKWSIWEMSKRLLVPCFLSGLLLISAPLSGLAEPTDESLLAEKQVIAEESYGAKAGAILKGAWAQTQGIYHSVVKVDERLIRKDETINVYKLELAKAHAENKKLRNDETKRTVVSGIRLASATQCLQEIDDFLKNQVEGR